MRKLIIGVMLIMTSVSAFGCRDGGFILYPDSVLDEVVVIGAKANKEVTAAVPIHLMNADEMKLRGISNIADALHRIPGITLRDYGGAGGMKTVSVRGMGAGHTAVVYDDMPVCDIQNGQVDVSRYSTDNVSNLSMIIGDNDDVFIPARAAAAAATLSISGDNRLWKQNLRVNLKAGSFSHYNASIKGGMPLDSKVYVSGLFDYINTKNDYPFTLKNDKLITRERRNNSKMHGEHAEFDVKFLTSPTGVFSAKCYYYDNSRQLPGPVIYYNNENHETLHDANFFTQLRWKGSLSEKFMLLGGGKFNYASSFYHDEGGKYPGGELNQNYWQREAYGTASLLYIPSTDWTINYSADYFFNSLNSSLPSDIKPYRNTVLQALTGKFSVPKITVIGRLLYTICLNEAKLGTPAKDAYRLSPSLSVSLKPIEESNFYLRAGYKDIFRIPTFSESYFYRLGNPDLKPEKTRQINIGSTYALSNNNRGQWDVSATVDGYLNLIDDMIVAVPYNMFVWSMTNLGKAHVWGLDATINFRYNFMKRQVLTLNGSYALQRAEPRTNPEASDWMKQVAYIPLHSGSVSLAYENKIVNLSLHGTGLSERFTTNNNLPSTRIPGYFEMGVSLWRSFEFTKKINLQARFDLNNIFDKQYCLVARYPMPGRSWMITITFNYK